MNKQLNILSLILILFIVHDVRSADSTVTANSSCTAGSFVRIEKCCLMPKMITSNTFKNCVPEGTEVRAQDGALNAFRSYSGTRGGPSGPACLMNCILGKSRMISGNGDPDFNKINRNLMNAASGKWKKHVEVACKECMSKIRSLDSSQLPIHVVDGQTCKSTPILYVACVKHRLALNCGLEDMNKEDDACPDKVATIRTCDPLIMRNKAYPMLRAYRMRKNQRNGNSKASQGTTTPMKVVTKRTKNNGNRNNRG